MKKIIFAAALCLSLTACGAAPAATVEQQPPASASSAAESSAAESNADAALIERLKSERGLEDWQIHSLTNQSFRLEDMFALTDAEIAKIFAPGNHYDGRELEDGELEKRVAALAPRGITEEMYLVLMGLGYTFEEMPSLTKGELDFVFPNVTLFERLIAAGAMPVGADIRSPLPEGCESYRDVIQLAYFGSSAQVRSTP